jgi:hypothetical protein
VDALAVPAPADDPAARVASAESPAGPETVPVGLTIMQALDDAIMFRRAQLNAPCTGCAPGRRCPEHAADARLITSYQRHPYDAYLQACAVPSLDPADAMAAAGEGDTQTLTAWAVGASFASRLRQRAAGPVLADLGDGLAAYVLDGDDLIEYPVGTRHDDLTS